jgi:hypothetical protein
MAQSLASAGESTPALNSLARGELIRSAVKWLAEREAEVKLLNASIRKYKTEVIRGHLGFKLADFNAVFRVSQLELEDRNSLLECLSEGFKSLNLGGTLDWVSVQESAERALGQSGNGHADGAGEAAAPRRGRGRPRKRRQEAEADAEF